MTIKIILATIQVMLLLSVLVVPTVYGYPRGAGACPGGKIAVGGSHTSGGKNIFSGKLQGRNIKVSVGGVTIAEDTTAVVPYGKALPLIVEGTAMRGVLVRIQSPSIFVSTRSALSAGSGLKKASVCKWPSAGITQTSSTKVNTYSGNIKFNKKVKGIILDITVVFSDSKTTAEHVYGRIKLDFTATA